MNFAQRVAAPLTAGLAALAVSAVAGLAAAQSHGDASGPQAAGSQALGKAVYERACGACHTTPTDARAAPLAGLRRMSAQTIMTALTTGVMKPIGDSLSPAERRDVTAWLAAPEVAAGTGWIDANRCKADRAPVSLSGPPAQLGFGVGHDNARRMSRAQSGLATKDVANLEVAWAFAMPKTSGLRGQGVVVGQTLYYPAGQAGYVVALDTRTGCVKWATETPGGVRNSLAYGRLGKDGPMGVVGGDAQGMLVALDAATGKIVWKADPRHDKAAPLSGSPLFAGDKIIVPISAMDVAAAMRPTFECCKAHGAAAAVDASNGKVLWTWHTMDDAKPLGRKNSSGVEAYGPSGAPIWSSPAVDLAAGVVYVSTGENTSPPATATSNAIAALDLSTGKQKWIFQALANDIWNMSCPIGTGPSDRPPGANCYFAKEGSVLLDHDFGGGPVVAMASGRKVILGGQKSGDVWALDARDGKVLWRNQFGKGTALGGVHWGIATDGRRVFAPISDPNVKPEDSAAGMHAMDIATGKVAWQWRSSADCAGPRAKINTCANRHGLSAAPLVIDGALLAGSLDGRLWVFDAATGKVLAMHDTARSFPTVNGLPGAGGSIDAAGLFAGDGMVFVNSGYGSFGQAPGNVLVAYRVKR